MIRRGRGRYATPTRRSAIFPDSRSPRGDPIACYAPRWHRAGMYRHILTPKEKQMVRCEAEPCETVSRALAPLRQCKSSKEQSNRGRGQGCVAILFRDTATYCRLSATWQNEGALPASQRLCLKQLYVGFYHNATPCRCVSLSKITRHYSWANKYPIALGMRKAPRAKRFATDRQPTNHNNLGVPHGYPYLRSEI